MKASIDDLYKAVGALVVKSTGRLWWRRAGIQAQPTGTYATVYITNVDGIQNQVVENVDYLEAGMDQPVDGQAFFQQAWNTSRLEVEIDFFRSKTNDTVHDAASRFRAALMLEERFWDLWKLCGLIGGVTVQDISAIFRAETEPRVKLRFHLAANVADPLPLADTPIYDIESEKVIVSVDKFDEVVTQEVTINNDQNVDPEEEV